MSENHHFRRENIFRARKTFRSDHFFFENQISSSTSGISTFQKVLVSFNCRRNLDFHEKSGFGIFLVTDLKITRRFMIFRNSVIFAKIALSAPPSPEPYRTCRLLVLLGPGFARLPYFRNFSTFEPKWTFLVKIRKVATFRGFP